MVMNFTLAQSFSSSWPVGELEERPLRPMIAILNEECFRWARRYRGCRRPTAAKRRGPTEIKRVGARIRASPAIAFTVELSSRTQTYPLQRPLSIQPDQMPRECVNHPMLVEGGTGEGRKHLL